MMYKIFKHAIKEQGLTDDIRKYIDILYARGGLSKEQYEDLMNSDNK